MAYRCQFSLSAFGHMRTFPGTYNARRGNLEGFWKGQFGRPHGLPVVDTSSASGLIKRRIPKRRAAANQSAGSSQPFFS
jgi:hypothetical protein